MKKGIVFCIIFSLLASFAVAQNEIYNELGSNGIIVSVPKTVGDGNNTGFGGLYDTVFGRVQYNSVGAEIKYTLKLSPEENFKNYSLNATAEPETAYLWFNPIQWMQILVGKNFTQALPGSYMVVYDDYTNNGIYGDEFFGMNFLFDMVQGGFSIPKMTIGENFSMKVNFGINGTFTLGGSDLNVGATYKMENESFGIFASYGSIYDKFYVGGGYTFHGENLLDVSKFKFTLPEQLPNTTVTNSNVISLTGIYNGGISVGGDLEVSFGDNKTALYAGGLFAMGLMKNLTFKFTGAYGGYFVDSKIGRDRWSVDLYPRVIFNIGKHRLIGGMEFNFYEAQSSANADSDVKFAFAIPISWRYTF